MALSIPIKLYTIGNMNRFVTFVVMLAFWLLWSGMFDAFHITLGVISSGIVAIWTGRLFLESHKTIQQRFNEWIKFEIYSFWLLWQIIIANIQVLKLAFQPHVLHALSPSFVTFETKLMGDIPKFILAQSITLTPGTVTVSIENNTFKVHAINKATAAGIPGEMEDKIYGIYSERHA